MKSRPDGDIVWVPVAEVAFEYSRHPFTIRLWCSTGYAFTLGWKVKKDETGHWLIGMPQSEYRKFHKAESLQASVL